MLRQKSCGICLEQFLVLAISAQPLLRKPAGRQEALPALPNQNDEGTAGLRSRPSADAARDEKGPEIFILSLAQDTRSWQTSAKPSSPVHLLHSLAE